MFDITNLSLAPFSFYSKDQLEKVFSLDVSFFPLPWGKEAWSSCSDNGNLLSLLLLDQEISGFILYCLLPDLTAHLLKILVLPELRGQNYAEKLFKESLEKLRELKARSIYLEVAQGNTRACRFYDKNHFQKLHLKKGYYSNGENAWSMALELLPF